MAGAAWEGLRSRLRSGLAAWHEARPERVGPDEGQLRAEAGTGLPKALVTQALGSLVREGAVVREGTHLRLPGHTPRLSGRDAVLWERIQAHLGPEELKPPVVTELASRLGMNREPLVAFLSQAVGRGQLVRVAPNRFFHPEAVRALGRIAEGLAAESPEGSFDARAFRDRSGIGRNLTIQVLEYLDVIGLTRRIGDLRRVLRRTEDVLG